MEHDAHELELRSSHMNCRPAASWSLLQGQWPIFYASVHQGYDLNAAWATVSSFQVKSIPSPLEAASYISIATCLYICLFGALPRISDHGTAPGTLDGCCAGPLELDLSAHKWGSKSAKKKHDSSSSPTCNANSNGKL